MRNRVVSLLYHNEFFGKFCKLQQGSQSVMEYHKKFLYSMEKANIRRSPKVLMERFLFGLREELTDKTKVKVSDFKKNIIDRHKKRISSTSIFKCFSNSEMEEFVEYVVDEDVSLEDSKVKNFSTGSLKCFVDSLVNYGGINMDEKKERQLIAHFG
ncbi:hypothetical protein Ahy_A07g035285 [Arachis hypogaea]|uniref:Retrotransposon gag domain-containing protein n=1 Tax=Arachis hypogaea TaxID=3818 RepID=A0A445CDI1_ARAHY|nr:hypothetical protein Ahy_A07g035285 [Arachis hypogaea]